MSALEAMTEPKPIVGGGLTSHYVSFSSADYLDASVW